MFAIESIAIFCLFRGYWPSKNWSREHDVKDEFASLAKSVVFGTTGKIILCWSIIVTELIADFGLCLGYWLSKTGLREHVVKGKFVSLTKSFVFATAGKKRFM